MSTLRKRSRRRFGLSVAIAAITAAAVVSDWPAEVLSGFWADHSMASGLVSGLILFFLAAFVIEEWIQWREKQQWSRVSQVAYKVLAHILRQQGQYLHFLYTGRVPRYSPIFPVDKETVDSLSRELERLELNQDLGGNDELQSLIDDQGWRHAAFELVRQTRLTATSSLAQWSGVMLQTPDLARDFNRVAETIDALSPVQRLLNDDRVRHLETSGQVRGSDWVSDLVQEIETARLLTVQVAEDLHRVIGDTPEFESAQRRWLPERSLEVLRRRDEAWRQERR